MNFDIAAECEQTVYCKQTAECKIIESEFGQLKKIWLNVNSTFYQTKKNFDNSIICARTFLYRSNIWEIHTCKQDTIRAIRKKYLVNVLKYHK